MNPKHRSVIRSLVVAALGLALTTAAANDRPHLLVITVDDMSADSMGVYGCPIVDITPQMDMLARRGMRFEYAHVQVGNCMPSRNVMWSGLYPHNNGVEGFYQVPTAKHPHLVDVAKASGYFTAIRHKVSHSTPYHPYGWDLVLDTDEAGRPLHVKDASSYRACVTRGIQAASSRGKSFCMVINVADPHKPFYAEGNRGETIADPHVPSKVFSPDEVPVPRFLFDDAVVRKELSHYYDSVRRADDCVGAILESLRASGLQDKTVIVFLSDHGMPLPFAKTQLYHHSTRTPLAIVCPGVTQPNSVDNTHMVSAVDLLPTLKDLLNLQGTADMDGRSFAPLLKGESQSDREFVLKEYNENAGGSRDPMRAIQTKTHLYVFNPWSDGSRVMATATTGTSTYRRMKELAETNTAIQERHDLYQHRVVEELYNVVDDPNCLVNLVDHATAAPILNELRQTLDDQLVRYDDDFIEVFRKRNDPDALASWMRASEQEAAQRNAKPRKQKAAKNKKKQNKA